MFLKRGVAILIFVTCSYTFDNSNELKSEDVSNITSSEIGSPDIPEPELPLDDNQLSDTPNNPPSDQEPIVSDTEEKFSSVAEEYVTDDPENGKIPSDAEEYVTDDPENGKIPSDAEEYVIDDPENGNDSEIFRLALETAQPPRHRWVNGIVLYFIDEEIYDDIIIHRIQKAMNVIQSASCVVFKRILESPTINKIGPNKQPWLHFTNPQKERECVHGVRFGTFGEPVIILGFDCMQDRDIIHALLHALGFKDEVTHPQRDSYVRILWDNIQPRYRYLFKIQDPPLSTSETLTEYDTMSIMHFHDRAYSINGAATIASSVSGLVINPSERLSLLDKMKLRLAFGQECNRRKVSNLVMSCKKALADSNEKPSRPISQENSENPIVLHDEDVEEGSSDFDVDSDISGEYIEIPDGGPKTEDENKNTDEENKKPISEIVFVTASRM